MCFHISGLSLLILSTRIFDFSITTSAKLQIFGYFTKDLDHFAPMPNQKQSTFDIACGFLLNDKLNSTAMSEMLTAWNSDMRLLRINQMREVPGMDALKKLSDTTDRTYSEKELEFFPCTNKGERDALLSKFELTLIYFHLRLELYEKFPYGVHKFNLDMIKRRRFELIVDVC
jgi:hypothetical protein